MIREGKYAEKLVEVASTCNVREDASTGVADESSACLADIEILLTRKNGSTFLTHPY